MSRQPADEVLAQAQSVERALRATRNELVEEVFVAHSADERVTLHVNGELLALKVNVSPDLIACGAEAVERGVMQAINDAVITVQSHTTTAYQQAFAVMFGLPPNEEIGLIPSYLGLLKDA